ncbi:MAG: hypothetical protein IPM53_15240 [Anaerolineaceae bacterium]|nr:hypothetical protein [Anaerolineaceae bacterium]
MANTLGSQSKQPRTLKIWPVTDPFFWMAMLVLSGLAIWIAVSQWGSVFKPRPQSASDVPQTVFTEETGIHITLVALTADGGIIDIRYQVVDPEKSVIVHDDELPPTILHVETGTPLLFTRHEHSDFEMHSGVVYSHHIINSGGLIKRGDRVAVRIGTSVLEEVPVQ